MEVYLQELNPEIPLEMSPEENIVPKKSEALRVIFDILETVILALIMFFAINTFSARVRVDGFSMRPTLQDGEFVLVSKISYKLWKPQRGDIIVFHYPLDPTQDFIKRVIGLPGDLVEIKNQTMTVNGTLLDESYIAEEPNYEGSWKVSNGKLFVLGDNRNDSSDSHSWGLLPYDHIIGKAILIYWPFSKWNLINHASLNVKTP